MLTGNWWNLVWGARQGVGFCYLSCSLYIEWTWSTNAITVHVERKRGGNHRNKFQFFCPQNRSKACRNSSPNHHIRAAAGNTPKKHKNSTPIQTWAARAVPFFWPQLLVKIKEPYIKNTQARGVLSSQMPEEEHRNRFSPKIENVSHLQFQRSITPAPIPATIPVAVSLVPSNPASIATRTRLKSHHGAAVTSRVAGTTKNSSHITTLKSHHGHHFLKEFIAGANESSKSYHHIYLDQNQEILARAQSICNFWKKCAPCRQTVANLMRHNSRHIQHLASTWFSVELGYFLQKRFRPHGASRLRLTRNLAKVVHMYLPPIEISAC